MSPLEAAIRAVCRHLGADAADWRGFEPIGRHAVEALLNQLPQDLADEVRRHIYPTP